MRILKHLLSPLALLPLIPLASPVMAEEIPVEQRATPGPWSVTLRATYLATADDSSPSLPIKIEDKLIPEFDIGYRLSEHWALELVLTIPQEHDVELAGDHIGDFTHLPPTLLLQYLPGTWAGFSPYVGAGVNYTLILDDNLPAGLGLDSYSVGPAAQLGVDYALDERWAVNLDVKYMLLRSDLKTADGTQITRLDLDPWLFALGVKRAF